MTLIHALGFVKATVDTALVEFFRKKRAGVLLIHPQCVQLVDQIEDLTLRGGKRSRPFFVWVGRQLGSSLPAQAGVKRQVSGRQDDNLVAARMGVELFQTFALVHDDIMDEDEMRRGGQTVHKYFEVHGSQFTVHSKGQRYGESMALLAGDLVLTWADELMGGSAAWSLYQQMKEETILGQALDVMKQQAGLPAQAGEDIDQAKINEIKSAWYSVIRPMQIGASLAGGSQKMLEAIATYGKPVGLAFQRKDDLLDGEVSQEQFEKDVQPYIAEALAAIPLLTVNLPAQAGRELSTLLTEITQFVVSRTT